MARAPARQSPSLGSFLRGGGGPIPPIIVVLAAATFVLSIVGAIGMRHGFPLASWGALVPEAVLHGQLWRLFTWVLFEIDPISLLFACLAMVWFGRDLAVRWGAARFTLFYFGLATLIGVLVTGISFAYAPIREYPYIGTWPLQEATIILWASFYPTRQLLLYFVLPIGGRMLVLFTIGMTVLFSIFSGIEHFIPHFLAEALALAFFALPSDLWTEHKLRVMEQKRRMTHLRSIPRDGNPPSASGEDSPPTGRWLN